MSLRLEFVGSFPDPLHRLAPPCPEFALIGRSNVGKSSLLNAMAGRRQLAHTSSTPGKTQLVNVYRGPGFYLLDLPGYGFARANKTARKEYQRMLRTLLAERDTLTGVIWLLDVRHPISRDDAAFGELLAGSERAVLPVLTKVDTLSRARRAEAIAARAAELGRTADDLQPVSAHSGDGIADLAAAVTAAAEAAAEQADT